MTFNQQSSTWFLSGRHPPISAFRQNGHRAELYQHAEMARFVLMTCRVSVDTYRHPCRRRNVESFEFSRATLISSPIPIQILADTVPGWWLDSSLSEGPRITIPYTAFQPGASRCTRNEIPDIPLGCGVPAFNSSRINSI